MDTMLIQLTNQKAAGLLHELEALNLIKVLKENVVPKTKLSDKYKVSSARSKGKTLTNISNRCVANGTVFN